MNDEIKRSLLFALAADKCDNGLEWIMKNMFTVDTLYKAMEKHTIPVVRNTTFIRVYKEMGCDLNHLISNRSTILHCLIHTSCVEEARIIIHNGASVDIKDHSGKTQLELLREMIETRNIKYFSQIPGPGQRDCENFLLLLKEAEEASVPLPDVKTAF